MMQRYRAGQNSGSLKFFIYFNAIFFAFFTGFLSFIFQKVLVLPTSGNALYNFSWLSLFVFSFLFFLCFRRLSLLLGRDFSLIAFVCLVFMCSAFWSQDGASSLIAAVSLFLTMTYGYLVGRFYSVHSLRDLLHCFSVFLIFCTLFFFVFLNNSMYHELGFSSLFLHKNHASFYYGVMAIIFLDKIFTDGYKFLSGLFFLLSVLFMLYAASGLGIIVFFIGVFFLTSLKFTRLSFGNLCLIFLSLSVAVFDFLLPLILDFFGKDFTFTGRTVIWAAAYDFLLEKYFLGFGYQGFFVDSIDSYSLDFYDNFPYYSAPNFHNGYIELFSWLGLLGVIVFVLVFSRIIYLFCKIDSNVNYRKYYFLFFTILIMCLIENSGESVLFMYNNAVTLFISLFLGIIGKRIS